MVVQSKHELTVDQYNYLKEFWKHAPKEAEEIVADIAKQDGYHPAGYGCWGIKVYEEDGKYYVSWKRQNSCD